MTLEHLDTIIGFAVVLAGVSLLVTTLIQMVSALFSLRGSNLRWGIETLLKQLDPNLEAHAAKTLPKERSAALTAESKALDKVGAQVAAFRTQPTT
jgi:hypothetical protein